MATTPRYADTPIIGMEQISTANTGRDGTGTIATIATGATNGTMITRVKVEAAGTTTVGVVRLFIYNGTNTRLYAEVLITAITPSTSSSVWSGDIVLADFVLPNGYELRASTHNAEAFNVFAFGADV